MSLAGPDKSEFKTNTTQAYLPVLLLIFNQYPEAVPSDSALVVQGKLSHHSHRTASERFAKNDLSKQIYLKYKFRKVLFLGKKKKKS